MRHPERAFCAELLRLDSRFFERARCLGEILTLCAILVAVNVDTPAKQLLFSTVLVAAHRSDGESHGTGFLLTSKLDSARTLVFLATNKHVVRDSDCLVLNFIARDQTTAQPDLGVAIKVRIENPSECWVGHPGEKVDVALLNLGQIISDLSHKIFFRTIPDTQMPAPGDGLFIDAVEEITFIGYPDGRRDPANLTPIVRRGTTATPIELDFASQPSFLVDGSVFAGSSGSPVFLMNDGFYRDGPNSVAAGNRLALIGIVAATQVHRESLPVEVARQPVVRLAKELNLGIVYNWRALREAIAYFRASPPSQPRYVPMT